MLEPLILPLLARIRRELSRLIFLGLLFSYGLAALEVCGAGDCAAGLQTAVPATLGEVRGYLWHGMALAFIVEFAGGIVAMTIGLAWDWWKERPMKAAAKARAEAQAEAQAEARAAQAAAQVAQAEAQVAQAEAQVAQAEAQAEIQALRERMLRIGIDPDTGERLPHFNNAAASGPAEK